MYTIATILFTTAIMSSRPLAGANLLRQDQWEVSRGHLGTKIGEETFALRDYLLIKFAPLCNPYDLSKTAKMLIYVIKK